MIIEHYLLIYDNETLLLQVALLYKTPQNSLPSTNIFVHDVGFHQLICYLSSFDMAHTWSEGARYRPYLLMTYLNLLLERAHRHVY